MKTIINSQEPMHRTRSRLSQCFLMGHYSLSHVKTRQRKHHPKVTSGCITCKSRRIKCDEAKPACKQCDLTGRACGGYTAPKTWLFEISKPSNQTRLGGTALPKEPSSKNNQALEGRAISYFMEKTVPQLYFLSASTHQFWNHDIPLFGATWPPVRNLMIALAARHELASGTSCSQEVVRVYADHYTTALAELLELSPVGTEDVFLMCCFLMIALEAFGEPLCISNAVVKHVIHGFRILNEITLDTPRFSQNPRVIDLVMKPMFTKIGSTLAFFLVPESSDKIFWEHKHSRPVIPSAYNDLRAARRSFFEICRWRHQYGAISNTCSWTTSSAEFLDVQGLLERWWTAFKKYAALVSDYKTEEKHQVIRLESSFRFLMSSFRASVEQDLVIEGFGIEDLTVDLRNDDRIVIEFATQSSVLQDVVTQQTTDPWTICGPEWLGPVTTVAGIENDRYVVHSVLGY